MDGTVIDCIQFAELSFGSYFVDDIGEGEDRSDSQFYEGKFGGLREEGFVAKLKDDSRFDFLIGDV